MSEVDGNKVILNGIPLSSIANPLDFSGYGQIWLNIFMKYYKIGDKMTNNMNHKENILQTLIDEFEANLDFSSIQLYNKIIIQRTKNQPKNIPIQLIKGSLRGYYFEAYSNWILSQINTKIPECKGYSCPQEIQKEPRAQEGLTRGKKGEIVVNRSGFMLSEYDFLLIYTDHIEMLEMKHRLQSQYNPIRKTYVRLNRLKQILSLPAKGIVGSNKKQFTNNYKNKIIQYQLERIEFSRFNEFFEFVQTNGIPKLATKLPTNYIKLSQIDKTMIDFAEIEVELLNLLASNTKINQKNRNIIIEKLLLLGPLPIGQLVLKSNNLSNKMFPTKKLHDLVKENKSPLIIFLKYDGVQFRLNLLNSQINQRYKHKSINSARFDQDRFTFGHYRQSTGSEGYKFHQIKALKSFNLPVIDMSTLLILSKLILLLNDPKSSSKFSDQEILKLNAIIDHIKYILQDIKVKRSKKKSYNKQKKKKKRSKKKPKKNHKKKLKP
ncbi:hypothetical protein DSAG12_00613 [Promethearchaeum syntrophicum]|uniref:Uncharacterized protein n=1 Tax=Promethearchaeum syntrophicum TaxID=2594042 RepID=A0A5B9D870_9ARCH|nr:hypothetical protein [Candidatus Prometheoarchaeum syntrophicum]QEE14796.1 hypothetical protein DSAG12_00613 [Candidatus Prometheoarchaeum syntrophicum]